MRGLCSFNDIKIEITKKKSANNTLVSERTILRTPHTHYGIGTGSSVRFCNKTVFKLLNVELSVDPVIFFFFHSVHAIRYTTEFEIAYHQVWKR